MKTLKDLLVLHVTYQVDGWQSAGEKVGALNDCPGSLRVSSSPPWYNM